MTIPVPAPPGAAMAALLRFHRDTTWTGAISEGGTGPGPPATIARGSGRHAVIQDGRWIVGTSVAGRPWSLVEEYRCTPLPDGAQGTASVPR